MRDNEQNLCTYTNQIFGILTKPSSTFITKTLRALLEKKHKTAFRCWSAAGKKFEALSLGESWGLEDVCGVAERGASGWVSPALEQ